MDAMVRRGTECHTDHQMIRAKWLITKKNHRSRGRKRPAGGTTTRFNVSKLFTRDDQGKKTREEFQRLVRERAMDPSADSEDIEEKWSVVKSALCEAAQSILGNECRKHPDWFREKAATLKPLLEKRNKLYTKFLNSKKEHDKRAFTAFRTNVMKAMRDAKNSWFQNKAEEAQRGRFGGKSVWRCITDIQRGRRGLVPLRTVTVRKEDGTPCTTPEEVQQRWNRHFTKVLNVRSQFNQHELDKV